MQKRSMLPDQTAFIINPGKCLVPLLAAVLLMLPSASAAITEPAWSYALFGSGYASVIAASQNLSRPEIYVSSGQGNYWFALRYNVSTQKYDQVFVGGYSYYSIKQIRVADLFGNGSREILIGSQDGRIQIFDQATKRYQSTIIMSGGSLYDFDVADVDRDGINEIIACTYDHLYAYSPDGYLKWDVSGAGGSWLVIAQMDPDSALEIATTNGKVVDGGTHAIQWSWVYSFGSRMAAGDIDSDGYAELIVAESGLLWAYDVDRQLPKWSISISTGTILLNDIDNDGRLEIVVDTGYNGISAYDAVTLVKESTLSTQGSSGTNCMVSMDADSDGTRELLVASNYQFTVFDWQTQQVKWQTDRMSGPMIGPELGDLDGDGRNEIVVVARSSDSNGARILIFDALSHNLRANYGPILQNTSSIYDLKLRDVNGDGRQEILIAGYSNNGGIEIYSMDTSNNFSLRWTVGPNSFYSVNSVEAADVDRDGQMEIMAAASGYLYLFTYGTAATTQEWQSLYLRGTPSALAAEDIDQDGIKEMIAMIPGSDVYIFNGVTKELEAMIMGPFTAMRVQKISGLWSIVLGKSTGELLIYRYASGHYAEVYRKKVVNVAIDGFTIDSHDRIWVANTSTNYNGMGTLTELSLDGTVLATYTGFGQSFGLRTAVMPGSRLFFAAGSYSVNAFPVIGNSATGPDLDGDGKTDLTVWQPSTGIWYGLSSSIPGFYLTHQWGLQTDKPVPGDYDGDLLTDPAVWRPENGLWYILPSHTPGSFSSIQWGSSTDKPVAADFDGDAIQDIAVWRPSNGVWYILPSKSPGTYNTVQWGMSADIPVPGDYDGDGKNDEAVWRRSTGVWYILLSGTPGSYISTQWGTPTDYPVAADYDADGKTDIAVWRPSSGVWYIMPSAAPGSYIGVQWGLSTDLPVSGDYDGDGRNDIAVRRPDTGVWYILPSGTPGAFLAIQWGTGSDLPISSLPAQ
jgi:hypothetical protein